MRDVDKQLYCCKHGACGIKDVLEETNLNFSSKAYCSNGHDHPYIPQKK